MSSTQWEVVTKTRKQRSLEKKIEAHGEKKKQASALPKLEEILPSNQYRKVVSNKGKAGKDNHSPAKSTSSSSNRSKSPKKAVKKDQDSKKQQSAPKPPKPKSLEAAFRSITCESFTDQLELLKASYPGSELLWLNGVASFMNSALPFECDPIFAGKSPNYPSILASADLKAAIIKFLTETGETNVTYFYSSLLTALVTDLSKNLTVVGYKFLLQLIGQNWPSICASNMAKTALLRNSYQNRSNICLSIFWSIGQGGYQSLMEGLTVWHNLMFPNLELRSYTKYITEYLEKILKVSTNKSLTLDQQSFFAIYNCLRSPYKGIPKDCQESLLRSSALLLERYIECSQKHANLFLTLLRDIKSPTQNQIELNGCIRCLLRGDDCFKVWKMNYKKQIMPSSILLDEIVSDWSDIGSALNKSPGFQNFLSEVQHLNMDLNMSKKRDPNVDKLLKTFSNVQSSSAQQKKKQNSEQKKSCGCCKWMLGSIFLLFLIGGALTYDTNVNGKGVFAKSATGKMLANAGMLPYVEKAWYTTMSASARGYKWAEVNVPPYAKPVGKLACDVYKLGRNAACNSFNILRDFVNTKLPAVAQFLEQYVPGLPNKIASAWESTKSLSVSAFEKFVDIFKTQVLVGRLSPENLNKMLNDTQNAAWGYYAEFHKKVDAYAKLK